MRVPVAGTIKISISLHLNRRERSPQMKPMALAVFLSLAVGLNLSIEVVAQTANVEQTLLQLERDWEQANAKNDTAALDRILAPEYVSTNSDGRLATRAEVLARLKSGELKFTAFTQDDYKVLVIGDTAIVTGRSTIKAIRDGKDLSGQERWTDVFVRRNGRWQAVATHSSRIARP
jgi:ketosteroid isomerase-like protein